MEGKIMESGVVSKNNTMYAPESIRNAADPKKGLFVKEKEDGNVELWAKIDIRKMRREYRLRAAINVAEDLKKFSKIRLRKKRSKKKFEKDYRRYVRRDVSMAWLAKCIVEPIRRTMGFDGIGRKIFQLEELPSPPTMAYAIAKMKEKEDFSS